MNTNPTASPPSGTVTSSGTAMSPESRRAAKSAFFGLFVDFFDIYLPIVALAPAMVYFQPGDLSKVAATTILYVTFALTLVARPIGSTYFGHLGDKIGRRRTTLIAIGGFTLATFLIALLPGYEQTGYLGLALLIGLRFVGGFFMGGEYTGANSLALEASPRQKRGIVGGIIGAAYPCGYVAISIVTIVLLEFLPAEGVGSPYVSWGWRLPFLVGTVLGIVLFFYFRKTHESRTWLDQAAKAKQRTPLRDLFSGTNLKVLRQVFILMSGLWFMTQAIISAVPGLLVSYLDQPSRSVTFGMLVANVALIGGYIVFALLGQRYGRRRVLVGLGAAAATVSSLMFFTMVVTVERGGPTLLIYGVYTVCVVLGISPFALAHTYVIERFPTSVRASGYGVGYSTAIIVPAFYSMYMLALSKVLPYAYTPIVLIVVGGILCIVGALLGRENRDVEIWDVGHETDTAR